MTDDSTAVGYAVVDGGGPMRSVDGRLQNYRLILDGVPGKASAAVDAVLLERTKLDGDLHLRACFGDGREWRL